MPEESTELKLIREEIIPTWFQQFRDKNSEYGGDAFTDTGLVGQYCDMARKMIKLKRAMFDGEPEVLTSEGLEEVIMDMISHCFLSLAYMFTHDMDVPKIVSHMNGEG